MKAFTRRLFGKTVAASAAAAVSGVTLPRLAFGQDQPDHLRYRYPKGFLWGCSTAAYQVEGGAKEGGRGASVWDTFSHTPGKTHNGETGDVSSDSYHLYKDDVQLMKNLGVQTYRMSISWSRVFPSGTGAPNPEGMDYYNRVVDELFLATLSCDPSAEEKQVALAAIDKNRVEGAQNLQWALINQVEFFFNH